MTAAGIGVAVTTSREPSPGAAVLRVVYDVEDLQTGAHTRDVVELQRPLRSRRTAGRIGSATTEAGVYDRSGGRWRQVAVVAPGEPGADLRLSAPLLWAEQQQLARRNGQGTVAGRTCTWWLTREPLDLAAFAPAAPADRARSCVDGEGLLLADEWRAGGRDLRRRTVTTVERNARTALLDGQTPEPVPAALAVTAVERVRTPKDDLVTLTAPAGFELQAAADVADVEPGTATVVRRYVRGVYASAAHILVVDQVRGPSEGRGKQVDVTGFGAGRVEATGAGLVLTVELAPDQQLRVRTSLPYAELISWVGSLRRV